MQTMGDCESYAPGDPLPDFDAMWDYGDPSATETRFRELLCPARNPGNEPYLAQLLTQIARAEGLQRRFDDAHATLDSVESILDEAMHLPSIRYWLERGRVFNSSGRSDAARPHFLRAWQAAIDERADFFAVDAAHMLGIVARGEESLEWNEKALKVAEASSDPRARNWRGSLYNNCGWTCFDRQRYDDALRWFEKSLAWQTEQKNEKLSRIARWCIAKTFRVMGRVDDALSSQRELLERFNVEGATDGYVLEEIGECLLALDRPVEASDYFKGAFDVLSKDPWLKANEAERLTRLKRLSERT